MLPAPFRVRLVQRVGDKVTAAAVIGDPYRPMRVVMQYVCVYLVACVAFLAWIGYSAECGPVSDLIE